MSTFTRNRSIDPFLSDPEYDDDDVVEDRISQKLITKTPVETEQNKKPTPFFNSFPRQISVDIFASDEDETDDESVASGRGSVETENAKKETVFKPKMFLPEHPAFHSSIKRPHVTTPTPQRISILETRCCSIYSRVASADVPWSTPSRKVENPLPKGLIGTPSQYKTPKPEDFLVKGESRASAREEDLELVKLCIEAEPLRNGEKWVIPEI